MNCQSCNLQKARVHSVDSVLIPGMKLVLCTECRNKGLEPRHVVILASASGRDVKNFVVNKLYYGEPLQANEVIHSL
jgi:hypothetical protein